MCTRSWSVVMILIAGSVASAQPAPPRIGGDPTRDLRLTMQARKLLYDDPDLATHNLGVIVNDRVAVLWGPAPSAEAMIRAEMALRRMGELVEIRNKLFLTESLEPVRLPLKNEPVSPPKLPTEPRPILGSPGVLTAQENVDRKNHLVQILPPIALGMPQADETERKPTAPEALADTIRHLLQSKPAFRAVEFTLRDRQVYLKTIDSNIDVLHEAARAVSRLPNIDGVILLDKSSPR